MLVTAPGPAGLFYGLQTLRQLLPAESLRAARSDVAAWSLPVLELEDRPRFPWRGSHLDVSRHFLGPAFLKKHLELMALHKLNVFHWHLTDDQGWRLQLRRQPLLTATGAWRKETVTAETAAARPSQMRFDNTPHGGFYTPEEVRESAHILGAQGQLWTEFVATERHAEYMLWPRLAALAEVLWSPPQARDFPEFRERLRQHLRRLEVLDVGFHPLD